MRVVHSKVEICSGLLSAIAGCLANELNYKATTQIHGWERAHSIQMLELFKEWISKKKCIVCGEGTLTVNETWPNGKWECLCGSAHGGGLQASISEALEASIVGTGNQKHETV